MEPSIINQLSTVCPFPIDSREYFMLQIKSDDKRSTKWIKITPDQFRAIELILLEDETKKPISLSQRVTIIDATASNPSARKQAEWFIEADSLGDPDAQQYAGNPDLVHALGGMDAYSWLEDESCK